MKIITVRGVALGNGAPRICIPITAKNMEELLEQTESIRRASCDIVEWRADFYETEDGQRDESESSGRDRLSAALSCIRRQLPEKPLLFTFRTKEEGGERSIPTDGYRRLNEWAAATGKVDLVDLEVNRGEDLMCETIAAVHKYGVAVVGSFHDFNRTPNKERIVEILCTMQELGADITKAAVMPQGERDVLTLLDASVAMKEQYADRPFITMSMGRLGAVSRLSGFLTGSAITFATAGRASAPGQMDAKLVRRVLEVL